VHILTTIVGAEFTKFLVKVGGSPPLPPKKEEGHIPGISSGSRAVSNGTGMVTIGLPVFKKFGERFSFSAP